MKYQYIIILILILILLHFFVKCNLSVDFFKQIIYYKKYTDIDESILNLNSIPKLIIQTWKTEDIPDKYNNDIMSLQNLNPDYTFVLFTDNDIENFLKEKYPQYYESYIKLPVKILKIDYFRYIAIYHYGGFYFDLDITGLKPLNPLLNNYDCIFPVDTNIIDCKNNRNTRFCNNKLFYILGQYAFTAKPKNVFIKNLIDKIHNNINIYTQLDINNYSNYDIYGLTGPDFVTNVYLDFFNKENIHILLYPINQHFGEYAKHNYFGTWKK